MPIGNVSNLIKIIKEKYGASILDSFVFRDEATHIIKKDSLLTICGFLKNNSELQFNFLTDIVAVDCLPMKPRFEIIYHLYSIPQKHRLRLKVKVEDSEVVPSVPSLWNSANWAEREAYDMFGIRFEGHPNLKRIYMPENWEGFPLRKDYPLKGYKDQYNPYGEERK